MAVWRSFTLDRLGTETTPLCLQTGALTSTAYPKDMYPSSSIQNGGGFSMRTVNRPSGGASFAFPPNLELGFDLTVTKEGHNVIPNETYVE